MNARAPSLGLQARADYGEYWRRAGMAAPVSQFEQIARQSEQESLRLRQFEQQTLDEEDAEQLRKERMKQALLAKGQIRRKP